MKYLNKIIVGSAISGSFAGVGQAAIVSADFSSASLIITRTGGISIDFDTASFSNSDTVAGEDAVLGFFLGYGKKPTVGTSGDWRSPKADSGYAERYAFGDVIPDLLSTADTTAALDWPDPSVYSAWSLDSPGVANGLGYLGFDNPVTGNQAWLYIDYNDSAPSDADNTIRLLGVGYNNAGSLTAGSLTAGAVPEPSASALALLAGSVLAFKRRRRISA